MSSHNQTERSILLSLRINLFNKSSTLYPYKTSTLTILHLRRSLDKKKVNMFFACVCRHEEVARALKTKNLFFFQ